MPSDTHCTWERIARTGVTRHKSENAADGYVLFSPLTNERVTYLIDLEGEVFHRWTHEQSENDIGPGQYGYLDEDGCLFYNAKRKDESWDLWPRWRYLKGGEMRRIDWNGTVLWRYTDPFQHHDGRATPEGGAIYLSLEPLSEEEAQRVKGGHPVPGVAMHSDVIVEIDKDGNRVWEWHMKDHLDPDDPKNEIMFNVGRNEWTHTNAVVPMDGDRVLLSVRHLCSLFVVNKKTNAIEERIGPDHATLFIGQHDPKILENGNILLFDNGTYRSVGGVIPFSRIIEIDRETHKIVWSYEDVPAMYFYSPYISGVDLCGNGNVLATEGSTGRMFQVTRTGEVVWEYVNPYFGSSPMGERYNAVYKARFYTKAQIESWKPA